MLIVGKSRVPRIFLRLGGDLTRLRYMINDDVHMVGI